MARKVFFSFHYDPDCWRASQIRNIGALEGNSPVSDNKWEEIKKGGDTAIEKWIGAELSGKSCAIVLIGANTAGRKWINHEIEKGWNDGKGVLGIYIHNLKNREGYLACTRFRRHRVRCFDGAGGGSWRDGSLPASSSLRLCG